MSERAEVLQAAEQLVAAFARHDAATYFAGFDPEATFIFHNHPARLESRGQWEQLWKLWEHEHGFRILECRSSDQRVQIVSNEVAVFTHTVHTTATFDGEQSTTLERETIVFQRADRGWTAVHEHLSLHPTPPDNWSDGVELDL